MERKNNEKTRTIILALYPNSRGLSYACFRTPGKEIMDAGMCTVRPFCGGRVLKRVSKFIEFFRPQLVVLRNYGSRIEKEGGAISGRVGNCVEAIVAHAASVGVQAKHYTRRQIRDTFETLVGARSRFEIANQIVEWFPELSDRSPSLRKWWMDESYHMAVFDAVSLALTHLYLV